MLLADLQMPSITGSEAVDKYIYIPERPPDNQILIQFVILSLIQKNHSIPLFQRASFNLKKNLINMILKIYDEHSPYANCVPSILPETFTAVPNRQHSLSDIHYPSRCLCITNTAL